MSYSFLYSKLSKMCAVWERKIPVIRSVDVLIFYDILLQKECALMGREIYDIINDMAEVLNASQMQKLQEVLVKRLSENTVSDYLQTTNMDFLDMFLTLKELRGVLTKQNPNNSCIIERCGKQKIFGHKDNDRDATKISCRVSNDK